MSKTMGVILFFSLVFIESLVRYLSVRKVGREDIKDTSFSSKKDKIAAALPALGMFIIPLIYALTRWLDFANYTLPAWLGWLGVPLFLLSSYFLHRSHADLGKSWSPLLETHDEQVLVTEGVYRFIRHPMYSAHFLWGIAQMLLLQNWIAGPSMLLTMLPLIITRVPVEEEMLITEFGDKYREYMKRTKRFIPFLF